MKAPKKIRAEEAIQGWLCFVERHKSPRTLTLYKMVIRQFADTLPAKIKLRHITQEHIEKYLSKLPHSNKTINTYLACIWSFFRYYNNRFDLPNPAAKIKRLPESAPYQRVLTEEEYHKILAVCNQPERAAVELLAHTGLRANYEFPQALNPANVKDNMLHVVGKGNRRGTVPLNRTARNAIETLSSYLYFSKQLSRRNRLYYICICLSGRAGLPKFTPHSFRYYFGDSLRRRGVSVFTISKLYRHSTIKQTMEYLHLDEAELSGATDVLDGGEL